MAPDPNIGSGSGTAPEEAPVKAAPSKDPKKKDEKKDDDLVSSIQYSILILDLVVIL